jgi:hypothetical protein
MRIRTHRAQYIRTITSWLIGSSLLVAIMTGGYWYITRDISPLPKAIRSELTFSPLVMPKTSKTFTTSDYKFDTVENNERILSYNIHFNDTTVTVSEYTQPSEFSEIAEYKDRFLSNVIKQYATVQTSNGTLYLGRLSKQNDKQLAIMIEKGLLVFLSPSKDVDEAQWRNLGDQLEVQKVTN